MRLIFLLVITFTCIYASLVDEQIIALEKRLQMSEERLLLTHHDTHFSIGGRLQFDVVVNKPSLNASGNSNTYDYFLSPRSFSDNAPISKLSTQVKASRIWFKTDRKTSLGILRSLIEIDLWGSSTGTEAATNSYNLRVRHAYMTLNGWTLGQTYSTFMANSMPDTIFPAIDLAYARQALIKYTHSFPSWSLDLAFENPETQLLDLDTNVTTLYNDDRFFDSVARINFEGKKVKASVSVLLRLLSVEKNKQAIYKQAWGINSSLKYTFDNNDYIQTAYAQGEGMGRYISLGYFNAGELNQESIQLLPLKSAHLAFTHRFSSTLRTTLLASIIESSKTPQLQYLNDESIRMAHINLRYEPVEKVLISLEYIRGTRQRDSQTLQSLDRFLTSFSYIF